jgi:hypothetical protein
MIFNCMHNAIIDHQNEYLYQSICINFTIFLKVSLKNISLLIETKFGRFLAIDKELI